MLDRRELIVIELLDRAEPLDLRKLFMNFQFFCCEVHGLIEFHAVVALIFADEGVPLHFRGVLSGAISVEVKCCRQSVVVAPARYFIFQESLSVLSLLKSFDDTFLRDV